MNLYELIAANTAALIANTAALTGGAAAATTSKAGTTKSTTTKTTTKETPKGASREDLVSALTEIKEKFGAAEAKKIITKLGAAKMADIEDDQIDKGFKLAKAALEESAEPAGDDDGL